MLLPQHENGLALRDRVVSDGWLKADERWIDVHARLVSNIKVLNEQLKGRCSAGVKPRLALLTTALSCKAICTTPAELDRLSTVAARCLEGRHHELTMDAMVDAFQPLLEQIGPERSKTLRARIAGAWLGSIAHHSHR